VCLRRASAVARLSKAHFGQSGTTRARSRFFVNRSIDGRFAVRNLLFAGIGTLSLALSAVAALAATSTDGLKPAASQLVESRAAYEPAGEFGRIGNDFGPGFNLGAPASAKDFGGAEVSAEGAVIK
jgi:hypothetical protein